MRVSFIGLCRAFFKVHAIKLAVLRLQVHKVDKDANRVICAEQKISGMQPVPYT